LGRFGAFARLRVVPLLSLAPCPFMPENVPQRHPAIRQLVAPGYTFIAAETLEAERESLKTVVPPSASAGRSRS
jgi:hypothetical protein